MLFEPTNEQKNAIKARGTTLVSAAAGSGKTAVLVERVISRLLDDNNSIDADRLLVVTFTNAAAAEMKSRIEKRLNEEKAKNPSNLRINEQILLMQSASITTIDSFCISLIKENFDRLNLPPDFKIASDETVTALNNKILSEIYEREVAVSNELFDALRADRAEENLNYAILKIYSQSSSLPFPKKWRHSCVEKYYNAAKCECAFDNEWGEYVLSYFDNLASTALQKLNYALDRINFSDDEKIIKAYADPLTYTISAVQSIVDSVQRMDLTAAYTVADNIKCPRAGVCKNMEYKRMFTSAKKAAEKLYSFVCTKFSTDADTHLQLIKKNAAVMDKLISLVDEYDEKLTAALLKKRMLTFSLAEHYALSLFYNDLGEPIDSAKSICERYDEVLVDEYQDTNKLQDSLFYAISEGKNLFMVGDVKQSIYRFRHADPDGFLQKKDSFAPYGIANGMPQRIVLGNNFRSRSSVCDFVNLCFEALMSKQTADMDYDEDEHLIFAADFPENDGDDIEALLVDYDDKLLSSAKAEALSIAKYIKNKMSAGVILRDKTDSTKLRPAKYGDFAILMRNLTKAGIYSDTLQSLGIPVTTQSGNLFETPEVMTFLSLLRTVANPTRDIPLLSVMMSPIFYFSAEEIAEIKSENKQADIYTVVRASAQNGNKKAADMLDKLSHYRFKSVSMPIDDFLLYALEDSGYLSFVSAMSDGECRKSNLLSLISLAKAFSQGKAMSLSEFISRADRTAETGGVKTQSAATSNADAVKIITIHSSKGLQFPICILADCSGRGNNSDKTDDLLISEKLGIGLKIQDDEKRMRMSSVARDAISLAAEKSIAAEELRLLYVALTRAEEKLLIVLSSSDFEKRFNEAQADLFFDDDGVKISPQAIVPFSNYAKWFYRIFASHPECAGVFERGETEFCGIKLRLVHPQEESLTDEIIPKEIHINDELVREIDSRFSYSYPYSALNFIVAKTGVSRLAEAQSGIDYSFTAQPSFMTRSGLTPAQRGTASHKFLQYALFERGVDAKSELERMVLEGKLTEIEAKAISADNMQSFFDSELFDRILSSKRFMREVRFLDEIPASAFAENLPDEIAGEAVIVQGVADCIFEEEDGLVIVDYKTDRVEQADELVERYRKQLMVYAQICEKTYNKPVKECVIYSLCLSQSSSL